MNTATELESSLDGALSFFQNLRRSLGTLEAEASAQNDRLREIAASVATLQQDWQSDHQTLTSLASDSGTHAGQLTDLRTESGKLDAQLNTVESQITTFQHDQQALQHTLATLVTDLRSQHDQDVQATTEQQAASLARIDALDKQLSAQTRELKDLVDSVRSLTEGARAVQDNVTALETQFGQQNTQLGQLEKTVTASQERLAQIDTRAEVHDQSLQRLESALDTLNQTASTGVTALREQLQQLQTATQALHQDAQKAEDRVSGLESTVGKQGTQLEQLAKLEQLSQAVQSSQDRLEQISTRVDAAHEAATSGVGTLREDFSEQQDRFDNLSSSVADIWQDTQTLQEHLAALASDFETKSNAFADGAQTKQDLQKQQDRLRHLEALVNKVAGDTNSTRQILNVLQADLTSHSDLLREFDQSWRDHQELTGDIAPQPAAAPSPAPAQEAAPAQNAASADDVAALRRDYESLQQNLTTAQTALTGQDEKLAALRDALQAQLKTQADRCEKLEAALANLSPSETAAPAPATDTAPNADVTAALQQALVVQAEALAHVQNVVQEQIKTQQDRFGQLEVALANFQQAPATDVAPAVAPVAEAAPSEDLSALQQALSAQAETLNGVQTALQEQLKAQQDRLSQIESALDDLKTTAPVTAITATDAETTPADTAETAAETAVAEAPTPVEATAPESAPHADHAEIEALQKALAAQTEALSTVQTTLSDQLAAQQERFVQMENAIRALKNQPAADDAIVDDVTALQGTLAVHIVALNDFRETTQQRISTIENQRLPKEIQDIREQLARLDAAIVGAQENTAAPAASEGAAEAAPNDAVPESTLITPEAPAVASADIAALQKAIADLEARMTDQPSDQPSGGVDHAEEIRNLHTEFRNLQQNLVALDVLPEQMRTFYKSLSEQEQQSATLKRTVEQLQKGAALAAQSATPEASQDAEGGASLADLEAKVEKQREQINGLMAALEAVQHDTRSSQEKVVTMAANVAKRIFEFQDKLTISETVQTERLQDAEQKLIQLQAALDTLQTTLKGRSWFKMPATFATIMLVVGTAFLGLLARVIWTQS